jgi:D-alanyl-D-alanine carboxypeptidase
VSYDYHPELARARAVTGLCALANSQYQRATDLARLARASFVAQPEVSAYFKQPSARLDSQLRLRTTAP